jgi:hypothetical protein
MHSVPKIKEILNYGSSILRQQNGPGRQNASPNIITNFGAKKLLPF